jgi:hypothetical protein
VSLIGEYPVYGRIESVHAVFPKKDVNQALLLITEGDGSLALLWFSRFFFEFPSDVLINSTNAERLTNFLLVPHTSLFLLSVEGTEER